MTIKLIKFKDNTYSWQTQWNTYTPSAKNECIAFGKWMFGIDKDVTVTTMNTLKYREHDVAIYNSKLKFFIETRKVS